MESPFPRPLRVDLPVRRREREGGKRDGCKDGVRERGGGEEGREEREGEPVEEGRGRRGEG
eukprot:754489-Hanusia_phi.AAC.1